MDKVNKREPIWPTKMIVFEYLIYLQFENFNFDD